MRELIYQAGLQLIWLFGDVREHFKPETILE